MAIVPVVPVQAANDVVLSPSQGKIGDIITIQGTNFSPSTETSEKRARLIFAAGNVTVGVLIDNIATYDILKDTIIGFTGDADEGEFTTTFAVPASLADGTIDLNVSQGTYYLCTAVVSAISVSTIKSVSPFTVTPGATLDPLSTASGPVGTQVQITGANFPANTTIVIKYDDTPIPITSGDTVTKSTGIIITTITIPQSATGAHTISIIAGTSTATAQFTVTAATTIDTLQPSSGSAGTDVPVSGSNFPVSTQIIFKFDSTTITPKSGSTQTGSGGSFASIITIPSTATAGPHAIYVTAGSSTANVTFNVTTPTPAPTPAPAPAPAPTPAPAPAPAPSTTPLSISQTTGAVGQPLMVGGTGFSPNANISVKYDDKEIATGKAGANGTFMSNIFPVPPGKHGDHTITASDGTHTSKITFTVESVPPKIPQPEKPEMGVKVKSPITFTWGVVTDNSSPVTYNLQVASAPDFSASSLILDKTALDKSEYILTEAEELKLAGQESSSFWRVKAVDAALNESDWTGAGQFSIAQPFKFTGWLLYATIGVGVVLIFLFGFWMGRRTAFYY
jgi:hypothetical protein